MRDIYFLHDLSNNRRQKFSMRVVIFLATTSTGICISKYVQVGPSPIRNTLLTDSRLNFKYVILKRSAIRKINPKHLHWIALTCWYFIVNIGLKMAMGWHLWPNDVKPAITIAQRQRFSVDFVLCYLFLIFFYPLAVLWASLQYHCLKGLGGILVLGSAHFDPLKPRKNSHHSTDDIFKFIF